MKNLSKYSNWIIGVAMCFFTASMLALSLLMTKIWLWLTDLTCGSFLVFITVLFAVVGFGLVGALAIAEKENTTNG